ncbi:MAG: flippase-like domain-containing protein [Clostridia bacterium]|nr:flippase-like domain-containing protein [Clostridia bacterium]
MSPEKEFEETENEIKETGDEDLRPDGEPASAESVSSGGEEKKPEEKKKSGLKSRILWLLVFIVLVAVTIFIITRNKDFSFANFFQMIAGANPFFLAGAFLCMIGFVAFEALALRHLERFFGCPKSVPKNMVYSAADIYFSAITPSASGGQPASAVFMIKDGIPTAATTLCLLLNLSLYMISIVVIGIFCILAKPVLLMNFSVFSRVFIIAGLFVQTLLVALILLMALKDRWILSVGDFLLRFLHKIRIIKNVDARRKRFAEIVGEYRQCLNVMKGHKKVLFFTFAMNMLQRLSNIGVSVFVFLAVGGNPAKVFDAFLTGSFVVVGSNAVPIPGAVGISDALFLDGFSSLIADTVSVELLSRSISFYICIFVCGSVTLLATVRNAFRSKNGPSSSGERENG